ncbi:hypothetical protein SDRG_10241 [Saprolegnia diclina VS20]|uniref:Uncharacterized protein n=1 Tax=Saprolegnia diclina (strain VS20) TaxID=1156394 RepID=T0RIA7_SAPDV|nr:hypothetical protein SDRG_10241 [Saprolegnia diclina VS20]EQC32043.1 hypothetical protein SDRG_10241 [Saprolegnia diclina VS20]|eukprot:XP_008614445.1 hypothetical protein SDRG_10241 [Saprolegnia diclina VS20]
MRRLVGLLVACAVPILGQLRFMPMVEPMYVARKPLQFMPHSAASTCALVNRCDRYRFMPRRTAEIQPRPTTQLPTAAPTTATPRTMTPSPATTAPGATPPNATTIEPTSRPPLTGHPVPSSGFATTAPLSPGATPSYENRTPSPSSESTKRPHDDAIDRPNGSPPPGPIPMKPATDSSLSSGAIAGIAVGATVCVLGAAALLFVWKKKRVNAAKHQEIIDDHTTGSGQYFALL